jgi:hypothetical protein
MTFSIALTTDIGKIRLELGDDTAGAGVLPTGNNLTDEQLQVVLNREGSVMRTVAGVCELLSTRWAQLADLQVGPRRESYSQVSAAYLKRAAELRDRYGDASGTDAEQATYSGVFSVSVIRADGYSENLPSTESDLIGSEYSGRVRRYPYAYSPFE